MKSNGCARSACACAYSRPDVPGTIETRGDGSLRTGRVHRAYLHGLGIVVPCFVITHLLWGTPAWHAVVSRAVGVLGVANW